MRARRVTLFLVVCNLLILAAGLGARYVAAIRFPNLPEFNADKIRFWSQPDAYQAADARPDARPQAGTDGLCVEIADLSQEHFQELQTVLQAAGAGGGECVHQFDRKLPWWVFWPPEYEAAQRDKALQAMRATGLRDILPITQGVMAQAFSLGVFAVEGQARQYRDGLRSKGLARVEYGPRPTAGGARLVCVSEQVAKIGQLKNTLPSWAQPVALERCAGKTADQTG